MEKTGSRTQQKKYYFSAVLDFLEGFQDLCIFDKIIQNDIVQNGRLCKNDTETTGRKESAFANSGGIYRH